MQPGQSGFSRSAFLSFKFLLGFVVLLLPLALQRSEDWSLRIRGVNMDAKQAAESATAGPGADISPSGDDFMEARRIPMLVLDSSASRKFQQSGLGLVTADPLANDRVCAAGRGIRVVFGKTDVTLMIAEAVSRCGCGN